MHTKSENRVLMTICCSPIPRASCPFLLLLLLLTLPPPSHLLLLLLPARFHRLPLPAGLMALQASRDADIQACRDFGVRVGTAMDLIGRELESFVRYMGKRTFTSDRVHALLKSFKDGVCECVSNDSTRRHLWQTCKEVLATPGWQVGFRV